jgi:biotin carboxyl carrier protein
MLMAHTFSIGETEYSVWLSRTGDGYRVHLDDRCMPVALEKRADHTCTLRIGNAEHTAIVAVDGDVIHIQIDGQVFTARYVDPVKRHAADGGLAAGDSALAPMPGLVIAVLVQPGAPVEAGQTLVVIESMKLETSIKAWRNGRVAAVHVGQGESFERSAPLVTLTPVEAGAP